MYNKIRIVKFALLFGAVCEMSLNAAADSSQLRNMPSACKQQDGKCKCDSKGTVNAGCIKVYIDMGATTPWTGSKECSLKIFADAQSPMIFTPESLYALIGGYTFKRLGNSVLSDGRTPSEVVFAHPDGENIYFEFTDGESWGRPDPGIHTKMDERLMMTDAEGWAVTSDPVYYDLYEEDGTRRRFLATNRTGAIGKLVSITDCRGVEYTIEEMGIDIIYTVDGVRQFLTPSHLADVANAVDCDGYTVTVYPAPQSPTKDAETGLYQLPKTQPMMRVAIRSEKNGNRAIVTTKSGESDAQTHIFDYLMDDWSLTRPSGVQELKERNVKDSEAARLIEEVRTGSNERISRTEMNFKWESWGFAMTNRVEGYDGVTETTQWTYYTSGHGRGQVKTDLRPSGLLTEYAYDANDRIIFEKCSGPEMATEETTYGYTPVDDSDIVSPVDGRPRTVIKTWDGIECERTYYVYSLLTNVVERVGEQGAAYGGTNVLRTVIVFYPVVAKDIRSGMVKSVRHENGKVDIYDYALSSNIWTKTVTHLHEQAPKPVSGKTTRDITVMNGRCETIESRTEAYIDGVWCVIARDRYLYNVNGKVIRRENLAGQVTTTDWDCCHKAHEVQPDGSTTMWDYDGDGRLVGTSRLIPLDMTNVTWLTTRYRYDDLGRQISLWQTNTSMHIGLPTIRTAYDPIGRVIARIDTLGNKTTTSYGVNGRTVSVLNPNTSTRITTRSASGATLSVTGSAVTPEFYTYGILPDGCRWTKIVQGETADASRFSKRYKNMLGQTVREERSGFQGTVLATVNTYDSYNRICFTATDYEPTVEYSYSIFGGLNAFISRADGQWRKSEFSASFVLIDDAVWYVKTNLVSCSDSVIAPISTSISNQLSGLSSEMLAHSYTTDVRGNCSESKVIVSSGNITSSLSMPHVDNAALTISRCGFDLQYVSINAATNVVVYDHLGRQISAIDGRGNLRQKSYDFLGLQVATVDALQNRTMYTYTQFGDLATSTDSQGLSKIYEYDLAGRKTYEGGATYPVRYTYDIFGNKTSMATYHDESLGGESGDITLWLYDDASGLMTNKVYANGKGSSYTYTPNGKILQRKWARGILTDYHYDGWGNLTNIVYSDDTPTVSLAYDVMGRQTNVVDAAGVTIFTYDRYGAVTNETVIGMAYTNTIVRYFDAYGRDTGYALNGTRQTTIGYDSLTGRITSMVANGSDIPFTWTYCPVSDERSFLLYPNGLSTSWKYDANGRLLQVRNTISTNVLSQYDYCYDTVGRRVGCLHSGTEFDQPNAITYHYNTHSELTNIVSSVDSLYNWSYEYDDIGNRVMAIERGTNITYLANQLNQYSSVGDFSPRFDDDGNQTLIRTPTGVWSILYNGENRPVSWNCGTTNITMVFDYRGRRVAKGAQNFIYNDFLQIADSSGNAYIWDPTESEATRPLGWSGAGHVSYYVHDGGKNVSDIIDSENGDCVAHYEYAPYGFLTVSRGVVSMLNHLRWSSEYMDDDIGTVYYNYRHYDYLSGRWMCMDIIGEDGGLNLYAFLDGDPCNRTDYLGMGQSGMIECGGNCKICLDNDAGSGDGNVYKIHWACNQGRKPRTCRQGDKTGSARLPGWLPSHGTENVPDKIKKCVERQTKWIEKSLKAPVPIPNTKCCKDREFQTYELTFPSLPNSAPQPEFGIMPVVTCMGLVFLMVLLSPAGI